MLKTSQPCCFLKFSHHTKNEKILILILMTYLYNTYTTHVYTERKYTRKQTFNQPNISTISRIYVLMPIWIKSTRCYNTRWWSPVFCLIRCSCVAHYTQALFSRKKHLNSSLFILLQQNTQNLVCCCCVQYKWEECIIMWRVYKRLQSTDFVYSVYGVAV